MLNYVHENDRLSFNYRKTYRQHEVQPVKHYKGTVTQVSKNKNGQPFFRMDCSDGQPRSFSFSNIVGQLIVNGTPL